MPNTGASREKNAWSMRAFSTACSSVYRPVATNAARVASNTRWLDSSGRAASTMAFASACCSGVTNLACFASACASRAVSAPGRSRRSGVSPAWCLVPASFSM